MGKGNYKEIIDGIKAFMQESSDEFKIEKIIIFGSFVSGKMKSNSDIDLILVSKSFRGKKFFKRGIGLHKYWKLDLPVDFLCFTPEEFREKSKRVSIVSQAIKDGMELA
jgi:predicted nucleotidyltransferase